VGKSINSWSCFQTDFGYNGPFLSLFLFL